MKKIIVIAFVAVSLAACNSNEADKETTIETKDSTTSMTTTYTAVEGDVKYTGNRVMVMRNGQWVEADEDVKLDNGVMVNRNGRVTKDDNEIELREGEMVNKTGEFFDNTGQAIENAWDVTKEGAKDAGRAIKNTAKKVGQRVEDAVDRDTSKKK
jgi:predicted small secreted protein